MDKCCAQFIVTRERIKKRPKAFYEMILKTMSDPKKNYARAADGKNLGRALHVCILLPTPPPRLIGWNMCRPMRRLNVVCVGQ
jgi:hypothetical protein